MESVLSTRYLIIDMGFGWRIGHVNVSFDTDGMYRYTENPSRYAEYVTSIGKKKYEVEHIWVNKPEQHGADFAQAADFLEYRNRIGDCYSCQKALTRAMERYHTRKKYHIIISKIS